MATTKPPQRQQGAATRTKLLQAGMQVLAERGYHAARVDDVVSVAQVSHGSFYLYFANKEALILELARSCADELGAMTKALGDISADAAGRHGLHLRVEHRDFHAGAWPAAGAGSGTRPARPVRSR